MDCQEAREELEEGHEHQGPLKQLTEQIDSGSVDARAAIANGYADAAADEGLQTAGHADMQQLARYFCQKQSAYVDLFSAIVKRVARVASYSHLACERREQKSTWSSGKSFIPFPPPLHQANFYEVWHIAFRGASPPPWA